MFNCSDCKYFIFESHFNNKRKKVSFCKNKEKFDFDLCPEFAFNFYDKYKIYGKKQVLEFIEYAITNLAKIKDDLHMLQHFVRENCKDDDDKHVMKG